MKKINKYILSASTISLMAAPIVTVIACSGNKGVGDNDKTKKETVSKNDNSYYDGDVLVSSSPNQITKENSVANFADINATMAESNNSRERQTRRVTGQPFALHFHARDLKSWKPENDVDNYFNKATVKLKNRKLAEKYLNTQTEKELSILASLTQSTSNNEIGTVNKNEAKARIFTMWSHISKIIGWGGSSSEGNFVIPKGDDINAAHRNGVPILATLFMAPNSFGGNISQYEDMVVQENDRFPVADSMIALAKYYGFDGWFLNLETTGVSNLLRGKMSNFLKYLHEGMKKDDLYTVLYDYNEGQNYYKDGSFDMAAIDFQNRDKNLEYMKNIPNGKKSIGYNYDRGILTSKDEGGEFNYSNYNDDNLWIYSYFRRHDPVEGDKTDLEFFSSSADKRDPRISDGDKWTEMSKYFQDRTTINSREKFSTSFEQGFGSDFYVNGVKSPLGSALSKGGYRNSGLQDILPTYTWINDYVKNDGTIVNVKDGKVTEIVVDKNKENIGKAGYQADNVTWKTSLVDNELTYYGTSLLKYKGRIEKGHHIESKLYASNVEIKTGDEFSMIVRDAKKTGLIIWSKDKDSEEKSTKTIVDSPATQDLGNGFSKLTFKVPSGLDGKEMKSFGISIGTDKDEDQDVEFRVANLAYTPIEKIGKKESVANKIIKLRHDGNFVFNGSRNIRINWDMTKNEDVDHYRVWSTSSDGYDKKDLLTVTSLPAAYLKNIGPGSNLKLIIEAIDANDSIISSTKVKVKTTFKVMNDKSKWTSTWSREENDDSNNIIQTNNGYNTVFKDEDGSIYIGDDYSRLHKIALNGSLLTSQSKKWGQSILGRKDGKDTHTLSIFSWNDDKLAVLTSKGTLQLVDKKTGAVDPDSIFDKNILNKAISGDSFDVNDPYNKISSVSYAGIKDGIADIVITPEGKSSMHFKINVATKNITKQIVGANIAINKIVKNGDKFLIAYQTDTVAKDNLKTNIIESDSLDLSSLASSDTLQTQMNNFVTSSEFKTELEKNGKTEADETEFLAKGNIIDLRKINGKIMALNSWGIAMILNGTQWSFNSAIDTDSWGELSQAMAEYDHENDGAWMDPVHGVKTKDIAADNKLSTTHKIWKDLFELRQQVKSPIQKVFFDEETNTYGYSLIQSWSRAWWGHWNFNSKMKFINVSNFLSGSSSGKKFLTADKTVELSKDEDKKVDSVRFVVKTNGIFVVGGSTGKIAAFNSEFNQIPMGRKIYKYDGDIIQVSEKIYNDNDYSIPEYLTK